jgi:alpha-glucuronidase
VSNRDCRNDPTIIIGTLADLRQAAPQAVPAGTIDGDGFLLRTARINGVRSIVVTGQTDRGVLYGSFALLKRIALGESVTDFEQREVPYSPIRWINHWDNLDGTIERGYGGRSIFWENGKARDDLSRVTDYARMLASLVSTVAR